MSVQEKPPAGFLIRRIEDRPDRCRWFMIGLRDAPIWCSEERYAQCFPSREAAEFALLRLEGCEVVER